MEHTGFDSSSRFIDVGSGIGKPNLHVAQYPGVQFSCGVEMEHTRWSLGMTCLKATLDQAVADERDGIKQGVEEQIQGNCVFLHSNILEAKVFNPFTHVYMFSIGKKMCEAWSRNALGNMMLLTVCRFLILQLPRLSTTSMDWTFRNVESER